MDNDDLSPEFLAFSEMLDQEEALSEENLSEDGRVLLELRQALRADTEGELLPPDFTSKTAKFIRSELGHRSLIQKTVDALSQQVQSPVLSLRGAPKAALLALSSFILAWKLPQLLPILAFVLGLGAFTLADWRGAWKNPGELLSGRARIARSLFYLLPLTSIVISALLSSLFIGGLGAYSISFKNSENTILGLQVFVGLAFLFLCARAFLPLCRAVYGNAKSSPLGVLALQLFFASWLAGFAHATRGLLRTAKEGSLVWNLGGGDASLYLIYLTLLGMTALVTFVCLLFAQEIVEKASVKAAISHLMANLLLGFVPLMLAVWAFYQAHLTKDYLQPQAREEILQNVEEWLKKEESIKKADNGWVLLRPYFLRGADRLPEHKDLIEKFDAFVDVENFHDSVSYDNLSKSQQAQISERKPSFLEALEKVRQALAKPEYSSVATEGWTPASSMPNYTRYRTVAISLNLLFQEAIALGRPDEAIDYLRLNLRWADKDSNQLMISLMISLSLNDIALRNLEETILEGHFKAEQLREISELLELHALDTESFRKAMERDTVLMDRLFRELEDSDEDGEEKWREFIGLPSISLGLPSSYWSSERKAYWNYQLSDLDLWTSFEHREQGKASPLELYPFNLGVEALAINFSRAITRFSHSHSKAQALRLVTLIELYKLEHGEYPEDLPSLTLQYISHLPKDLMDPKDYSLKGSFAYQKTDTAYILTSESEAYKYINEDEVQVYGQRF